jgi:aryl-alcohol dehydrogenase-like predicted oxidoreductase
MVFKGGFEMNYRRLGKTGFEVSEISLGTWQLGGKWGDNFNVKTAEEILNIAIDNGINFIDTADGYNGGLSEKAIGKILKKRSESIRVATKCGRRLNPHVAEGYNRENIRRFVEDSLRNMELEVLDLIQLHCPPTDVYNKAEVFEALEELKREGKIVHYGVSVEKVEEALKAIEYPGLASVQIIFNMFRQKPAEQFFKAAKKNDVGIIVRVPLASGLLTGKMNRDTVFSQGDHRFFNRNGEAFDKGETFSGVDYELGLKAVEELKETFGEKETLANLALRWILMFDEVSCIIPGASRMDQVVLNIKASDITGLSEDEMDKVKGIYDKYIKSSVHHLW